MEPIATPRIHPGAFVAPGTHLYGDIEIGPDAVIMFGTVIRAELDRIRVGARSNVQDNSVLHADEGGPVRWGRTPPSATRWYCTAPPWVIIA